MPRFWFLIVLNAPVLAEVIRKYLIHSDMVFLAADAAAFLSLAAIAVGRNAGAVKIPPMFYAFSCIFVFLTLVVQLFSESNFGIYAIGARANYMPFIYLLLSAHFFNSDKNAAKYLFTCATFWIIVAALMATAQIILGKDHPINSVWGHQGVGIGDYSMEKGQLIDSTLFRPTSIFMHTGKFGQTAFVLVLFRLCYTLFSGEKVSKLLLPIFAFDMVGIFISGQRGAFIFLAFGLTVLIMLGAKNGRKTALQMFVFTFLGIIIVAALVMLFPQYGSAFSERFSSAIVAIPARLQGNLIDPFETIFSDFVMLGRGFGYYTFGAKEFGGTIVYQDTTLTLAGYGESSIIRMCVEAGFLATLVNGLAFAVIYRAAFSAYKSFGRSLPGASAIFFLLWIASLIMWSNTADVFGNTVPMFYGYALSGAILLTRRASAPSISKSVEASSSLPRSHSPLNFC